MDLSVGNADIIDIAGIMTGKRLNEPDRYFYDSSGTEKMYSVLITRSVYQGASIVFISCFIFISDKVQNKTRNETVVLNFLIGILFSALGRNFSEFSRIGNYHMLCGGGILAYNLIPESVF